MNNSSDVTTSNILTVESVEDALVATLQEVFSNGEDVAIGESHSIGAHTTSKEILNYVIRITSPRDRIVHSVARGMSAPLMVARFTWLMAGSDRLADIAFYEERVRHFSDDGISVPGSNFGQRILRPRPGVNQLTSAIDLLGREQGTRRAAISIYQPEDCGRVSADIPCALALTYQIREDSLLSTTIMRSNNAYGLLPSNLFEFSLLSEVVACELGIDLGTLTHFTVSMHIYTTDFDKSNAVIREHLTQRPTTQALMTAMPRNPSPLTQIRELVILESLLRHDSAAINLENLEEWAKRGTDNLHEYWAQFYFVLLWHVLRKNQNSPTGLNKYLTPMWRALLSRSESR